MAIRPAAPPPTIPSWDRFDTAGMAEALDTDGFVFIPGVLTDDEVQATRAAIDRLRPFGFDRTRDGLDHYKCVFNRDALWMSYLDRPGIIELAEATMGDQCHIIGMSAWRSHPGYGGAGLHVDETFVEFPEHVYDDPAFRLPIWLATAHFYLDDIDEELCPTWVIPGSHRAGRPPRADETTWNGREAIPVLCRAGDVLFFRSEIWHRGSANRSDRIRYLLQVHYSHRKIAQKFSPWPWHLNPEVLATATERQLRLLGKHPESNYG